MGKMNGKKTKEKSNFIHIHSVIDKVQYQLRENIISYRRIVILQMLSFKNIIALSI